MCDFVLANICRVSYRLSQSTFSFSFWRCSAVNKKQFIVAISAADVILLSVFLFSSVSRCLAVCVFVWVSVSVLVCFLFGPSSLYFYSSQSSVTICLISLLYDYILYCAFMFVCVFVGITAISYFQDNIRQIGLLAFWRCLSV